MNRTQLRVIGKLAQRVLFSVSLAIIYNSIASAAVMVTNVVDEDTEFFAANVSGSDLIEGLPNVSTNFNASWGPEKLNNGVYAGFDLSEIAWVQDPGSTTEFTLGSGAYGLGYEITSINSMAAWNSADFRDQLYDVYVKYLGDSGFTFLASVDNQPSAFGSSGSTQSTIFEDETGLLASHVIALRFEFADTSTAAGSTTFSEIDVFGTDTAPPPAPEPSALALLSGILVFAAHRRKRRG